MGQKNAFSKVIFFLFLFLLPLGEVVRIPLFSNVSIHPSDIVIFLLVVCFLPLLRSVNDYFIFQSAFFLTAAFFISLVANVFVYKPEELLVAAIYFARFVCYLLLLFIVASYETRIKKIISHCLVFVGFVVVMLGYLQYFFYPNLRNLYYAGWDEHLYRMFSTFLDPNFAGAFFVMYLLMLLGLFLKAKQNNKFMYGVLGVLTLGAILLTYSRSAYLMFGVSIFVFLFLQKQKKLLFLLLGIIILVSILFFFSPKSEGTNLFRTASSNARILAMQQAITIIKDNPIFGVGFNAYRYAQGKHGFLLPTKIENHAGAGTDNSFLFVLATTGIVGFGAYVYLWYAILGKLYYKIATSLTAPRNDKAESQIQTMRVVVLSSTAGLLVNAMFINSLFYPPIMAILWIELGLIMDYK